MAATGACGRHSHASLLTLGTTTSVGNSGLLDGLLPLFRQQHGIEIRAHLVGSGMALRMMSRGDVDVVISHAPTLEASALHDHSRWRYRKIMFNDFVLVGPADDPAHVRGSPSIEEAMRRIAASPSRFLSRGDESGTHQREKELWALAGARPAPERLVVAGAGMGSTLRIASETGAYTLTDRATFGQLAAGLRLKTVFEGGPPLLNTYAVIVNMDGPRSADASAFADWLADGDGRRAIAEYRLPGNIAAFTVWPAGQPRDRPDDRPR
jgi:tungstate transport system substrate-binding protein